ncbi:MAG: hypothetical protein ABUL44_04285 [Flavobacterium sp.]
MKIIKKRTTEAVIVLMVLCSYAFHMAPVTKEISSTNNKTNILANDSLEANQRIISFLQWYKINLNKANNFPLLGKDSKGYYIVNKKACADYLDYLESSRSISTTYIGYWKRFFDDKAITLQKDKIKTDVPEGFDMDFVLITQEPEIILNNIDSLQFTTVSLNSTMALIGVNLPSDDSVQYEFEMRKNAGIWQIDYISTPNYD